MKKERLIFLGCVMAVTVLGASFPDDYQAAVKLRQGGQTAQAEEAFVQLAERKAGQRATDESFAQAANCAISRKDYDKAGEYIGKIENPALKKLWQMNALRAQQKRAELLAMSKDEDIEKWPDALVYDGLLCRGRTYAVEQDAASAERDYLAAIRNTISADSKAVVYQALGELYAGTVHDRQKALGAYEEIIKLGPSFHYAARAVGARALLLAAEGKGEEAVSEVGRLGALNLAKVKDPYWICWAPMTEGDVYAAIGKKAEALARYGVAAAVTNAPADLLRDVKRKLDALQAPTAQK